MTNNTVLYARVSSSGQKDDLERQLQRLRDYTPAQGLVVIKEVAEISSGINGKRKKLLKILRDPSASIIIVEYKDRLARFGFEQLSHALQSCQREIRVINETEDTSDLVQDMVDVLTSFCARFYGQRYAKNRAKRALEAVKAK